MITYIVEWKAVQPYEWFHGRGKIFVDKQIATQADIDLIIAYIKAKNELHADLPIILTSIEEETG